MPKQLILLLSALFLSLHLNAQDSKTFKDFFYADARIGGLMFHDLDGGTLNYQLTGTIGYRITQLHGIGIGYHREGVGGSYRGTDFQGIGLDYRFATRNGFILKAGGGPVLSAGQYEDTPRRFEYTGGGYFLDFSVDYQLRPGITFGIYYSYANGMNVDSYVTEDFTPTGEEVFAGTDITRQDNLGLSIGYALPWRRKS